MQPLVFALVGAEREGARGDLVQMSARLSD
jgi:hypothetical protein